MSSRQNCTENSVLSMNQIFGGSTDKSTSSGHLVTDLLSVYRKRKGETSASKLSVCENENTAACTYQPGLSASSPLRVSYHLEQSVSSPLQW